MFKEIVKANNIATKHKNEAQLMLKHKAKVQAAEDKIMSNFEYIGEGYFLSKDPNDYLFYIESDLGNLLDSEAIEKFCPHQEPWKRKLFFLELEPGESKPPKGFDLDADLENNLGTLIFTCNVAKRCGNFKISNIIWAVIAYYSFGNCDWCYDYDNYQECDEYAVARIVYDNSEATIPIPLLKDPDSFKAKCNKKRPRPSHYDDGADDSLNETDKQFRLKSILLTLKSIEPDFMAIASAYLLP